MTRDIRVDVGDPVTRVQVAAGLLVGVLGGASRVGWLPVPALASYVGLLGGALLGVLLADRESLLSDSAKVALLGAAVFAVFVIVGSFTGDYRFGVDEFAAMAVLGPFVEPATMFPLYFVEAFVAAFVVKRIQRL